jgi:hypothetical protein
MKNVKYKAMVEMENVGYYYYTTSVVKLVRELHRAKRAGAVRFTVEVNLVRG